MNQLSGEMVRCSIPKVASLLHRFESSACRNAVVLDLHAVGSKPQDQRMSLHYLRANIATKATNQMHFES